MAYYRIISGFGDANFLRGGVTKVSGGTASGDIGGREGPKAEGEGGARGAGECIVGTTLATAVGVAATGRSFAALETYHGLIRTHQSIRADEGLIGVGLGSSETQMISGLVDASSSIRLADIAGCLNPTDVQGQKKDLMVIKDCNKYLSSENPSDTYCGGSYTPVHLYSSIVLLRMM